MHVYCAIICVLGGQSDGMVKEAWFNIREKKR